MAKATNEIGESQPSPQDKLWNPSGYMRNNVEPVTVKVG